MKNTALLIVAFCLASPPLRFYPARNQLVVEAPTRIAVQKCERIPLDYPDMAGRAEVCMGTTSNADIYALVVAPRGSGDERKASQRLFRSEDGGRTWKGYFVELSRGMGVAFTVLADDTMVIAAAGKLDTGEQAILFYSSKDLCLSWEVAGTIRAHPFSRIGEGFLSLTQLQDGTVLFPVCRWTPGTGSRLEWTAFHHSVFRSSDGDQNWISGAPTFEGVFEAHLVEMEAGHLLGAFRFSGGYRDWHQLKAPLWGAAAEPDGVGRIFKQVILGRSEDGGVTWHNFQPVVDRGGGGRPLLIFGETHGQLVRLEGGKVVLASDHRYPYKKAETVARVSEDGGRIWSGNKYHLSLGAGYPASVALPEGTVVTVVGSTRMDSRGAARGTPSVQAIRWKP